MKTRGKNFLSNEISEKKSQELIEEFSVEPSAHIGTALFAPWRKANNLEAWYQMHLLNRTPFAGGLYIILREYILMRQLFLWIYDRAFQLT